LLVPVLTAVQKRVASTLSVPKVGARAMGSDRMSPTMKAARASMACTGASARAWTEVPRTGVSCPPLASAR
jgi:hypothetical protein